jgi:uncharacterized membrane protein YwzB
MSKLFHIITALVTYQTGCWLLQSFEAGEFSRFHFVLTIMVGVLISSQISMLVSDFLNTTSEE